MKIKKGDKVKITAGRDKGKQGVVEKVYVKANKLIITGANLYKRHIKKNDKLPQGGIVDIPRPIDVSKISLICPKCTKLVKIGYKIEKNKKFRICKKCQSKI